MVGDGHRLSCFFFFFFLSLLWAVLSLLVSLLSYLFRFISGLVCFGLFLTSWVTCLSSSFCLTFCFLASF